MIEGFLLLWDMPKYALNRNILDKYIDHPYCLNNDRALPISSNQKMNEYLVEIAALSGVNKILGNRISKRTFGTTVTLMNGVPTESFSKMFGHINICTTQLYAKVLDSKVSEDKAPLMEKFVARYQQVNEVTESKISVDMALLRAKYQQAI
ncbi:site-specific recombinase XerD [Pedobacter sp. CG_S7]|uniref:hypothetical protein n=1 Tax=Pedobacter sp. CG_S7 TaxID=3143930 RepID=UPI003394E4C5